jgi:hypothetical protein
MIDGMVDVAAGGEVGASGMLAVAVAGGDVVT